MKKFALLIAAIMLLFCACTQNKEKEITNINVVKPDFVKEDLDEKFGTDEIYIVKTYLESPSEKIEEFMENGDIFTTVKHYQLSDGSWKTEEYSYKYKLRITGRMQNAAKDSTYEILSNTDDITFEMAWKAAGYSSNANDYFDPEDTIIVGMC